MRSDTPFYEALANLHGHRCPMSILGARLGFAARAALEARGCGPGKLGARYFDRTCALDGIQLATGCTLGHGNIQVEPKGEHRLVLWAQGNPSSVEAWLSDAALEQGRAYGELRERAAALPSDAPERHTVEREMEEILTELATAPDSEWVHLAPVGA